MIIREALTPTLCDWLLSLSGPRSLLVMPGCEQSPQQLIELANIHPELRTIGVYLLVSATKEGLDLLVSQNSLPRIALAVLFAAGHGDRLILSYPETNELMPFVRTDDERYLLALKKFATQKSGNNNLAAA
jgi:hypothetical protein